MHAAVRRFPQEPTRPAGAGHLDVLEGAGHWLPEHHPEALADLLLDHLAVPSTRSLTGG